MMIYFTDCLVWWCVVDLPLRNQDCDSNELCGIIEFKLHIQGRIQQIEHFSVAVTPSRHYFFIFASRESLACIKHWCHFLIRSMCVRCTYRTPFACISLSHQSLSYCCKGMSRQPVSYLGRYFCAMLSLIMHSNQITSDSTCIQYLSAY